MSGREDSKSHPSPHSKVRDNDDEQWAPMVGENNKDFENFANLKGFFTRSVNLGFISLNKIG